MAIPEHAFVPSFRRPDPTLTWWVIRNLAQIHAKWWLRCGEGRMGRFCIVKWRKFSENGAWRPWLWWRRGGGRRTL